MNVLRKYCELEKFCEASEFLNTGGLIDLAQAAADKVLPPAAKRVFQMKYNENLSNREIAKIIGRHEATVSRALKRANKNIASIVVVYR